MGQTPQARQCKFTPGKALAGTRPSVAVVASLATSCSVRRGKYRATGTAATCIGVDTPARSRSAVWPDFGIYQTSPDASWPGKAGRCPGPAGISLVHKPNVCNGFWRARFPAAGGRPGGWPAKHIHLGGCPWSNESWTPAGFAVYCIGRVALFNHVSIRVADQRYHPAG